MENTIMAAALSVLDFSIAPPSARPPAASPPFAGQTPSAGPAFPWLGGKGWLVQKIADRLPRKACYVEPFAGAAAMLLALPESPVEILNDRNRDLVGFYWVMQEDSLRTALLERLQWTPYAREEYSRALDLLNSTEDDPITRAWAFFVVSNAAFSGGGQSGLTEKRFATSTQRSQGRRMNYHIEGLPALAQRLKNVVIENREAIVLLAQYDSPDTLFFLDPPYYPDTRHIHHERSRGTYSGGEMDAVQHLELLAMCRQLKGFVALCGYAHDDYDDALLPFGWETLSFPRKALSSLHRDTDQSQREERVWINPRLARHLEGRQQITLFQEGS
jgi:DNA adenine methylase